MGTLRSGVIVDITKGDTRQMLDDFRKGIVTTGGPLKRGEAASLILSAESLRRRQLAHAKWPRRRMIVRSAMLRKLY